MVTSLRATVLSASYSCTFAFKTTHWKPGKTWICPTRSRIRASSEESDCNSEECAPEKEVGKVSMEWLAEDRTQVVGTFPPRKRGWTGYIEKDTAGQTNVYSVEPVVYVSESAISSGSAGSSADGSENTAGLIAFLALISIAAASSILLQVGKTPPPVQTTPYLGPPLTYYINKFATREIVQPEIVQPTAETTPEAPEVQVESAVPLEPSTPTEAPSLN